MPVITAASTLQDVCFAVCTALERAGTVAVLTGGSAATYYAAESYQSRDADFVIEVSADRSRAGQAMRDLGYREIGGTYHHGANPFTVEFPPGPLAIGGDLVRSHETVRRGHEILHVLSRTDSLRDRLAAFYFHSDRSALAAAVGVARSGSVDLARVQRWSAKEGESAKFLEFREALDSAS
jgi:hypothetical protein